MCVKVCSICNCVVGCTHVPGSVCTYVWLAECVPVARAVLS